MVVPWRKLQYLMEVSSKDLAAPEGDRGRHRNA